MVSVVGSGGKCCLMSRLLVVIAVGGIGFRFLVLSNDSGVWG